MSASLGREPLHISTYLAGDVSSGALTNRSLFAISRAAGHVFLARIELPDLPPGIPSDLALDLAGARVEAAGAVIVMADRILGTQGGPPA